MVLPKKLFRWSIPMVLPTDLHSSVNITANYRQKKAIGNSVGFSQIYGGVCAYGQNLKVFHAYFLKRDKNHFYHDLKNTKRIS